MQTKLTVLTSLILLTACANLPTLPNLNPFQRNRNPDEEIIHLHMLGWPRSENEDAQLRAVLNTFSQLNPTIQVSLTLTADYQATLTGLFQEQQPPDIFYVDGFAFPQLHAENRLAPYAGQANQSSEQISDFYAVLLDGFRRNNIFYCLPHEFRTLVLIYNRDLYKTAGLSPPPFDHTEMWTWDDLRNAAELLSDIPNVHYTQYGMALDADMSRWLPFFYQAGGQLYDEQTGDLLLNSPEGLSALDFYVGLLDEGFAIQPAEDSSVWAGEAFGNERVGMVMEGNWIVPYLVERYPDVNYGVGLLPSGVAGRGTVAFSSCYGVSEQSIHKAAAFAVVDWLLQSENMLATQDLQAVIPGRQSLADAWLTENFGLGPFLDSIVDAQVWQIPVSPRPGRTQGGAQLVGAFNRQLQGVIDGDE
ncbi:MAG: sugar ABC transporter substrate-binding protein, partial [Chloroflexota bacterium]